MASAVYPKIEISLNRIFNKTQKKDVFFGATLTLSY